MKWEYYEQFWVIWEVLLCFNDADVSTVSTCQISEKENDDLEVCLRDTDGWSLGENGHKWNSHSAAQSIDGSSIMRHRRAEQEQSEEAALQDSAGQEHPPAEGQGQHVRDSVSITSLNSSKLSQTLPSITSLNSSKLSQTLPAETRANLSLCNS